MFPPQLTPDQRHRFGLYARIAATLVYLFLLTNLMFLAVQLRYQIPIGNYLPPEYEPHSILLYAAFILVVLGVQIAAWALPSSTVTARLLSTPPRRFLVMLLACFVVTLLVFPDISQLQALYFLFVGVVVWFLGIFLPWRLYVGRPDTIILYDLWAIYKNRSLLRIWLVHNVRARYRQTVLGLAWIILLPLTTSVVLTIAFTAFLRIQLDVPIISFFLSGIIPYTLFSNSILNSTGSIVNRIQIIGQVYFPREILPLITLGEAVVDFIFSSSAMIVTNLVFGIAPNVNMIYLPLLFLVLVTLALGLMFIASAITVLIRDIPNLLSVLLQLLFYLTPVIYPVEQLPQNIRFIFAINPIAAIIQGFRDVIVYNQAPDLSTLPYAVMAATVALCLGYSVFKSTEGRMADMV
jgi:ABC-type polysaccharide/polyol phosphate export permease